MNKKISKEAKRQEKRLKAIRNNHVDKNKEKEGILCVAGEFIQCRICFRPLMHVIVAFITA